MAYDPGAIDATLAAAVGDEPGLIAELRLAFVESAERAYTLMT
ncbi:MAG TPA: Hpt domain-containing protein, partial [Sphingomonas sp.]